MYTRCIFGVKKGRSWLKRERNEDRAATSTFTILFRSHANRRVLDGRCIFGENNKLKQDRAKEAFKDLMVRHRNLRFVSVDATKHEMSIEKKLGLKPFHGAHQLLYFTRYNVSDKPKVKNGFGGSLT